MIDFLTAFAGRFHPLLVHFPIGILFLAFIFECFSVRDRFKSLKGAVQPALFWGTLFAIASAISGFFLRKEGGYDEPLADLHQNSGIATAVAAFIVYVIRLRFKFWIVNPVKRKQARIVLFIPLMLLLSVTGHLGGSLTHGEDYLLAPIAGAGAEAADPLFKIRAIPDVDHAILYQDVIQPILEARCYDCHSSRKQKGELRLDTEMFIERGGKDGPIVGRGVADSSILFKRLVLPLEDKKHMPPNEKPQLSSSEIALIKYWLSERPLFNRSIAEFENKEKITAIIRSLQEAPQQSWIPTESVAEASEKSLQKLQTYGLQPIPLGESSHYLMVSFTNNRNVTDEQLQDLMGIKDQLIWLNLSNTTITDQQMSRLSGLDNLRVLYLNNTSVTDAGVLSISNLSELRLLNLVGTRITDNSIPALLKLKKLTNLFLYQTLVSKEGIQTVMDHSEEIRVDTGNYKLEKLPSDTIVFKKVAKN
jgi:uncharacterized membrane protein